VRYTKRRGVSLQRGQHQLANEHLHNARAHCRSLRLVLQTYTLQRGNTAMGLSVVAVKVRTNHGLLVSLSFRSDAYTFAILRSTVGLA
jgi:hypothetical protein